MKKSSSTFAFFIPCSLVGFALYAFSVIVALLSFSLAPASARELPEVSGDAATVFQVEGSPPPTLGNYPPTSLQLSNDTTVTPDAAPANVARITVSTSTDFNGKLEGNPTTGVVRVTDAHPAVPTMPGSYTVTVTAFGTNGQTTSKAFALTVTTPPTCNPVTFAAAANFAAGPFPNFVAVGDFNGDGKQDLAITRGSPDSPGLTILLGNGAGGFTPATGSPFSAGGAPTSLAVGDFNGDGKQDLAVVNLGFPGIAAILLGNGAGGFSFSAYFPTGSTPYWVAVGDFNGDGKQDLAVANYNSANVSILLGNGVGGFSGPTNLPTGSHPNSLAVGDFNGDGKQDLAVANEGSLTVAVLLGNGVGGFSAPTAFPAGVTPTSVAVGDFNGDGRQDLVVANTDNDTATILLGNGAGGFSPASNSPFAAGGHPFSVAVGDFDGDGRQDFVTANLSSNDVTIMLGNGAGGFSPASNSPLAVGSFPYSVAVGDFTGDGQQDLAVVNNGASSAPLNLSILLRTCLEVTGAVSRKTQGGTGTFDVPLPLAGVPGVECRTGGANGDHTIVATFNDVITAGTASTSAGSVVGSPGFSGNQMTINLTSVPNAQPLTLTLSNVQNVFGQTLSSATVPMSVLLGDTNGSGGVDATDVSQTKAAASTGTVNIGNFRTDVNASGFVNATDVSIVKARSGQSLPP